MSSPPNQNTVNQGEEANTTSASLPPPDAAQTEQLSRKLLQIAADIDEVGRTGGEEKYRELVNNFVKAQPHSVDDYEYISEVLPAKKSRVIALHEHLKTIHNTRKKTLDHRWKKRTVDRQKALIAVCWETDHTKVPATSRPQFRAIFEGKTGEENQWTYLAPMINQQDLSGTTNIGRHILIMFCWF